MVYEVILFGIGSGLAQGTDELGTSLEWHFCRGGIFIEIIEIVINGVLF